MPTNVEKTMAPVTPLAYDLEFFDDLPEYPVRLLENVSKPMLLSLKIYL